MTITLASASQQGNGKGRHGDVAAAIRTAWRDGSVGCATSLPRPPELQHQNWPATLHRNRDQVLMARLAMRQSTVHTMASRRRTSPAPPTAGSLINALAITPSGEVAGLTPSSQLLSAEVDHWITSLDQVWPGGVRDHHVRNWFCGVGGGGRVAGVFKQLIPPKLVTWSCQHHDLTGGTVELALLLECLTEQVSRGQHKQLRQGMPKKLHKSTATHGRLLGRGSRNSDEEPLSLRKCASWRLQEDAVTQGGGVVAGPVLSHPDVEAWPPGERVPLQ